MSMGIPLFLLYAVYGVVNVYLPILLSDLGYSITLIGVLQGIFEAAGLVFPIIVSSRVDKKGNYGLAMILLALLMLVMLPPLVYIKSFWVTAVVLSLFAIGYKGAVPVSDALVSRNLGANNIAYGRVRVLGSIGFVFITLLLQFTPFLDSESPSSIGLWIAIPTVLFIISIVVIPGLLKKYPHVTSQNSVDLSFDKHISTIDTLKEFPKSFWIGITLIFLGFLGMTPSQRFFSLYVQDYLHLESYAGLWALAAVAEVPFMFFSGKFIRRFGTEKLIAVSLIAITLRNLVYAVFPSFGGAIAGQLFHSICFGLFHPAAIVFIVQRAPKKYMAVGMTLYTCVSVGLASVVGNVMGGMLIDGIGYRSMFVFFSIFSLIGLVLFRFLRHQLYVRD